MALLEPGIVNFYVLDCLPHTSKAGNKSVKLVLSLSHGAQKGIAYEYMSPNSKFSKVKVDEFHYAIGRPLNPDFFKLTDYTDYKECEGSCEIEIQKSDGYPDSNKVKRFIKAKTQAKHESRRPPEIDTSMVKPAVKEFFGDNDPFYASEKYRFPEGTNTEGADWHHSNPETAPSTQSDEVELPF